MELEGVVTGVARFGIFVQGIELPAEGLIETDDLPVDSYRFDRSSHTSVVIGLEIYFDWVIK